MKIMAKSKAKDKPKEKSGFKGKKKAEVKTGVYAKPQKEDVWEVRETDPVYESNAKPKKVWQLQEAKAMFCEVVKAAQKEPQIITVHGKETAVILSYDEYRKDKKPKMTLFEFFRNSPFYGIELDISPRRVEPPRDINL